MTPSLEERVCAAGCGLRFRCLPGSPQVVARPDCLHVCKGQKRSPAPIRHQMRVQEAMGASRRANVYRDVSQDNLKDEIKMAEKRAIAAVPLADEADPGWRTTWEAVVAAATRLKSRDEELTNAAIFDAAGVESGAWVYALRRARREIPAAVAAYYEDVLGRKMRGPRGPSTKREPAAQDEACEEHEYFKGACTTCGEEEPADAPPTLGEAVSNATAWLERLGTAERRRALRAMAILLDLDDEAPQAGRKR